MKPDSQVNRSGQGWRFEPLIVSVVLLVLICGLFWQAIFAGKVMSQADTLLRVPPWNSVAPPQTTYWPQNSLLRDQCFQFIPWRLYAVDCVRQGVLPLWNPYAYCGSPFIANDQSAVFYPLTGLHYLLPFHLATLLGAILKLYLAGLGLHYLLRRFGVSPGPSLVGAVGFVLCGSNILWLNHPHTNVTVLLPLLLLLTDKFIADRPRALWAGLWGLLVGVQFFGGHIESSYNVLLVCGLFFIYRMVGIVRLERSWKAFWRPVAAGGLASLLGLMIGAVQLLPTLEYLQHGAIVSKRERSLPESPTAHAFRWRWLPTLVMPSFYGNPIRQPHTLPESFRQEYRLQNFNERSGAWVGIPLMLLAGVLITVRRPGRHTLFFFLLLLFGFCVAYRIPGVFQAFLALPGSKLMEPMLTRFELLMAFSFCVLGAYGLDELVKRVAAGAGELSAPSLSTQIMLLAAWIALAGCAFAGAVAFYLADGPRFPQTTAMLTPLLVNLKGFPAQIALGFVVASALLLGASILCVLAFYFGPRLLGKRLWLIWLVLSAADLLYFAYDYNPIVDPKLVLPDVPSIHFLQDNIGHHRIDGSINAFPPSLPTCFNIRDVRGFDAVEVKDYIDYVTYPSANLTPRMRTMGVKFYLPLGPERTLSGSMVHSPDLYVYRLDDFTSRVQVVGQAEVFVGGPRNRLLPRLNRTDFDPRRSVILWTPGNVQSVQVQGDPGQAGTAEFVRDGINEVVLTARLERPGWLVLADTWYPGWRVQVDGKPAELLRANYTFRAVKLPPGDHSVRFHYRPLSFTLGLVLSVVGLLACTLWMWLGSRGVKPSQHSSQPGSVRGK